MKYLSVFHQPQVSAPPYIGMNMAVEGEGIRKPTANAKKHNELTTPRVIPSSKNKDASTETKAAAVSQHKQMSPEANNTKISTLSRPKEARNIIANLSGEALETLNTKNRRETKRKPEGSWATGSMYVAQSIPIATTFCSTDDGKLKGIIKRSKSRYSTNVVTTEMQPRVPRAMQIPKAVLKYSNDSRMRQRTQLPISIGPDSNGKHF